MNIKGFKGRDGVVHKYDHGSLANIPETSGAVKTVNGISPDENGNVEIKIPESSGSSVTIDPTLTQSGQAADAKTVGDALAELEDKIPEGSGGVSDYPELTNKPKINGVEVSGDKTSADYGIGNPTNEQVATAVQSYLDEHPEATTTVADGSITPNKTSFLKQYKLNLYDASLAVNGKLNEDGTIDTTSTEYMVSGHISVKKAVYRASHRPWYACLYKDGVGVKYFIYPASGKPLDLSAETIEFDSIRLANYGPRVPSTMMFSEGTLPDSYIAYDDPANIKTDIIDDSVATCVGNHAYNHVKEKGISDLFSDHSLSANKMDFAVDHWCNLCDYSKVSDGYIDSSGNPTGGADVKCTDFIPVEEGATYYGLGTWQSGLYDSNKKFIKNFASQDYVDGGYTIPTGENIAYMRNACISEWTVITKNVKSSVYVPATKSFRLLDDYARKDMRAYLHGTYGKRWFAVGDSITQGAGTKGDRKYISMICEAWRYYGVNYGISGTKLTSTNGDGNGMCERIKNYDETKCDIITIMGGVNDANNNVEIGSMDDTDTTTVYGAMKDICTTLLTKYAGKPCGFITPLNYVGGADRDVTKAIKEVAGYYGIPVLDMEKECPALCINDDMKAIYCPDGLHPSSAGHEIIARKIGAWMLTL